MSRWRLSWKITPPPRPNLPPAFGFRHTSRRHFLNRWLRRRISCWTGKSTGSSACNPIFPADFNRAMRRSRFNGANGGHYCLVPGLIVLVMPLIGAFLASLVLAREWERGTLEALFVTPVRAGEVLVSKISPYFPLGIIGLVLCPFASTFL